MLTKQTLYKDSFGEIPELPTVRQILAVCSQSGDRVFLDCADAPQEDIEFKITDNGAAQIRHSVDENAISDILDFPAIDCYTKPVERTNEEGESEEYNLVTVIYTVYCD